MNRNKDTISIEKFISPQIASSSITGIKIATLSKIACVNEPLVREGVESLLASTLSQYVKDSDQYLCKLQQQKF